MLHTGQHYDPELSQVFFDELGLGEPRYRLEVGGLGRDEMLAALRPGSSTRSRAERPDWVLVYGDTNSTLGGARAAGEAGVPLAHVEAGLRSYDLSMPEEHNRIETDRLSQLLFAPDERSHADARGRGRPRTGRGDGRRDGGRLLPARPDRARAIDDPGAARSRRRGEYVVVDAPPRGERRRSRGWGGSSRARPDRGAVVFPGAPADPRSASNSGVRPRDARDRAARLPRLRRARLAGARDRHRLRRPAEGGLLVRRAVRDRAAEHRVGRHGRGGRERARRRRPRPARRGGPHRAHARTNAPPLYGDGHAAGRIAAALYPSRPNEHVRHRRHRRRLRRHAARPDVRRGGQEGRARRRRPGRRRRDQPRREPHPGRPLARR